MPLAYSYIRFSTPRQADGESLARQTRGTTEWCAANGYDLVRSYEDLGVSARRGKNSTEGALSQYLAAVRGGRVPVGSALVIEQLDRLSRDAVRRATMLVLEIMDLGIDIVTVGDGRVYRHDQCEMIDIVMVVVQLSAAHAANEHRIKRVQDAMDRRRERAIAGEIMSGRCPGWLTWDKTAGVFVPIPERADVVRQIFNDFLGGEKSTADMCVDLNKAKIGTMRGTERRKRPTRWTRESIKYLLRSPAVIGRYTPGGSVGRPGETRDGYYPAIVDLDVWSRVQTILDSRKATRVRDPKAHPNLLVGLCLCSICGNKMQHFSANGRQPCLHCDEPGCSRATLDHRSTEMAVLALLRDQITEQDLSTGSGERDGLRSRISEIERERRDLETQIDHTLAVSSHGGLSPVRTAERVKRLEDRITVLGSEETLARATLQRLDSAGVRREVDQLRTLLQHRGNDAAARRQISNSLQQIVEAITVNATTQQLNVRLRGSGVQHVLTPLSARFRYVEDAPVVTALQIRVPDHGDVEQVETELLGGNILVDRYPLGDVETIYQRPRLEQLKDGRVLIHPRVLAAGQYEILSLAQASERAGIGHHRLGQLCRAGEIHGSYQGVDGRWQIPMTSLQHVKRRRSRYDRKTDR